MLYYKIAAVESPDRGEGGKALDDKKIVVEVKE